MSQKWGHFLEFGLWVWLDIAYIWFSKIFLTILLSYHSCPAQLIMLNYHKLCKNETKMRILAIFSSKVNQFDLQLHILILSIVPNDTVTISLLSCLIDYALLAWLMQKMSKKAVFGHFLKFGTSNWLESAYSDFSRRCFSSYLKLEYWSFWHLVTHAKNSQNWLFLLFTWVWLIELTRNRVERSLKTNELFWCFHKSVLTITDVESVHQHARVLYVNRGQSWNCLLVALCVSRG